MAEMHEFLFDKEAKSLLPADLRTRIGKERRGVREYYVESSSRMLGTRDAIRKLLKQGYAPPSGGGFTDHMQLVDEITRDPAEHSWNMGSDSKPEALYDDDDMLLSGLIAAEVVPSEDFWKVPDGFSGISDFHGTVGAMLLQKRREIFWNPEGYTWETASGVETFLSRITADHNGDFRMERVRITPERTVDPFGKPVHYRPFVERDRQVVAPSYGCEPTILAAALKYVDQEKIDVPCLREKGKGIREFLQGTEQERGPFGDFGQNLGTGRTKLIMMTYAHPLEGLNEGQGLGWGLGCHYDQGTYQVHLDAERKLSFTLESEALVAGAIPQCQSLTFAREDMEHVILGLFAQTRSGLGRTSAGEMLDILDYRFSEGFEEEMKRIRAPFDAK